MKITIAEIKAPKASEAQAGEEAGMISSPALPYIAVAVTALSLWQIYRGVRTGVMHFGVNTISINCDRRKDPRGFWIYGTFNAMTAILCIWLLIYPR